MFNEKRKQTNSKIEDEKTVSDLNISEYKEYVETVSVFCFNILDQNSNQA